VRLSLDLLWSWEAKLASHLEPGCASLAKHGYLVAGLAANFIYCSLHGGSSWKRYVRAAADALRADLGNFLSAPVSGLKRGSVRMRGLSADIVAKVGGCEGAAQRRTCSQGFQARIRKKHCWFVGHCRVELCHWRSAYHRRRLSRLSGQYARSPLNEDTDNEGNPCRGPLRPRAPQALS
jgi:hypothetical protein